jgi:glutamyl-tRNA synthetase
MAVRTRYAPSPTGNLHVGGAWMAFFTWLFTRHEGGEFVLRIEDTDRSRSTEAFEAAILDDLRWLGIRWDEGPDTGGPYGPYRQTERTELYRRHAAMLGEAGAAYPCYCLPDELDAERGRAAAERRPYRYSGRCRELTAAGRAEMEAAGRKATLRFRVPSPHPPIVVDDLVLGRVEFAAEDLDDFIIQRSDGTPLYNFANVVDDHAMRITHITRGAEHLSNTPRQFLMYDAFGWPQPRVAHFPSLLGVDRKKLSKRHGDTAVREYKAQGYLPEAIVNFFALMGWYPEDGREIFSVDEMIERFRIQDVGKSGAVFDQQKLTWMNGVYLRGLYQSNPDRVIDLVIEALQRGGLLKSQVTNEGRQYVAHVVATLGDRLRLPSDAVEYGEFYFVDEATIRDQLTAVIVRPDGTKVFGQGPVQLLRHAHSVLSNVTEWNIHNIEQAVRTTAKDLGLSHDRFLIHPLRVALTAKTVGPGLFELMEVLGKERVLARLDDAAELLEEHTGQGTAARSTE